jgi:hypothetical protein
MEKGWHEAGEIMDIEIKFESRNEARSTSRKGWRAIRVVTKAKLR